MKEVDLKSVAHVAGKLERIDERFAFLGGAILPILLDHPTLVPIRPTKDVDVVVEVVSWREMAELEERLRRIGFKHNTAEDAPKCMMIVDGIKVDIMSVSGEISG